MKERIQLCLRNLARHGWRTRIILLIALFGSFLTFLSENLIEDVSRKQSDMFGRAFSGHFRVLHRDIETRNTFGFYHYEPEEMLQPDEIASVKKFLLGIPEVSGAEERIVFTGLMYGVNDVERGFRGVAMDMSTYNRDFTDLYYARGIPIAAGESEACAASWYEYERDKTVEVGKRYVFLVPNRDGEFVDRFATVKGGIDYRTMPKDVMGLSAMYFDLAGFRTMVGYTRPLASEVVGFLRDARTAGRVLPKIDDFLRQSHPRLKVVSWREYAPIFAEIVLGFDVMMKTVEAILLAICVLLVVKLTTFSIIERYSEIGTMRALGFSRSDIALQFALEGFLIIAAGTLAGFLLAACLITLFHVTGIHNSLTFFAYVVGDGFRPSLHAAKVVVVGVVFRRGGGAGPAASRRPGSAPVDSQDAGEEVTAMELLRYMTEQHPAAAPARAVRGRGRVPQRDGARLFLRSGRAGHRAHPHRHHRQMDGAPVGVARGRLRVQGGVGRQLHAPGTGSAGIPVRQSQHQHHGPLGGNGSARSRQEPRGSTWGPR